MLKEILLLALVGCVFGKGGMLIPDIVSILWIHSDTDDNGFVTETEFLRQFINNYDHDASGVVTEHEFTLQWGHSFHESKSISLHVFQHFDLDGDGEVTRDDLLRLYHHMDYDGNDEITEAEFFTLMGYIYGRIPYN